MTITTMLLLFGGLALVLLAVLQGIRVFKGGKFTTNFSKSYGLIVLATFGVALATATVSDTAKSAAYGLLGTIAGYLAGSKASTSTGGGNNDNIENAL